jgi:hypothetical protein
VGQQLQLLLFMSKQASKIREAQRIVMRSVSRYFVALSEATK